MSSRGAWWVCDLCGMELAKVGKQAAVRWRLHYHLCQVHDETPELIRTMSIKKRKVR